MFDKIKAYFWMGLAMVLAGLLVVQTLRMHQAQRAGDQAVVTLATERESAAVALASSQEDARNTENKLQDQAAQTRKEINEATLPLAAQRDALLVRVRRAEANLATAHLVSRTTAAASHGAAPSGDTGGELLGTIGQQDVGEAHRAETIRLHLKACYRRYGEAREALSK